METPNLDPGQRARQHWFADGLPSVTKGLLILAVAFFIIADWGLTRGQNHPIMSEALVLISFALYAVVLLRQKQILEWLKTKITYPRAGYVLTEEPSETTQRFISLGLSSNSADAALQPAVSRHKQMLAISVAVAGLVEFGTYYIVDAWVFTASGILVGAALWITRKMHRLSPLVVLAFPVLGLSMSVFLPSDVQGMDRFAYFLLGAGVLLLVDGGIAVIKFMRRNPVGKAA